VQCCVFFLKNGREQAASPYSHGFDCRNTGNYVPLLPFPHRIFNPPPGIHSSSLDCYASILFNKSDLTIYCYLCFVLSVRLSVSCHVMICVPDPKMCYYTDNVCNQEVFWISFVWFVFQAKYETLCVCSWWGKYITLKYHVC
jgi:hypothetical protein